MQAGTATPGGDNVGIMDVRGGVLRQRHITWVDRFGEIVLHAVRVGRCTFLRNLCQRCNSTKRVCFMKGPSMIYLFGKVIPFAENGAEIDE